MKIDFITSQTERINSVLSFIDEWNESSKFIKVSTSGSTGTPKTIEICKEYMRNSALMTGRYLQLKKNDTALLCMSTDTIAGKMMIVRSLVLEMELIVTDITSTPLKDVLQEIDFAAMVPMQVEKSISDLKKIKTLIVGGGVISSNLWKLIEDSHDNAFQTYGMTETISHIAMRKIKANSVYSALPGITIHTKDDCLVIDAPLLGVNQLKTNDIVTLIDGHSFTWLGRCDFIINSGGIKINPEEIESKLSGLINVPFFISGIPDELLGERLVLCCEGKIEAKLTKVNFKSLLDKYHIPKEIYFFQSFCRTESQKINRLQTISQLSNAEKQVL